METLSDRLKRLRKASGLSVSEVARRVGVSISTYREWEYGRSIKGEPYLKIAGVFDVALTELLVGEGAAHSQLRKRIQEIETIAREVKALL